MKSLDEKYRVTVTPLDQKKLKDQITKKEQAYKLWKRKQDDARKKKLGIQIAPAKPEEQKNEADADAEAKEDVV